MALSPTPTPSPIPNLQSRTPIPTATNTPPTPGPTLTPSITPTPQPTFTRPAAPDPADWEHYWLNRPVPITSTVWTNKIYPYGSTRGGSLRTHHGVEFDVPAGTPIFAAAAGTVVAAGPDDTIAYGPHTNFYGNLVVIQHEWLHNGQPVLTLYGHLSQIEVTAGQHVAAQEQIALSGASGVADGPHLHFEVRVGQNSYDTTRNPLLWLYPFPDRGVIAGRVTFPGGALAQSAPITLRRIDGSAPYAATTSYADATVLPDDGWNENFALDDVYAGYYEVIVSAGDKEYKTTTWVYPYQTSFVEIVLGDGE
jgi:murein DD-endopeptidase MepM/ murein hydrolase activator NlpD